MPAAGGAVCAIPDTGGKQLAGRQRNAGLGPIRHSRHPAAAGLPVVASGAPARGVTHPLAAPLAPFGHLDWSQRL
jgi:hypothetical protein